MRPGAAPVVIVTDAMARRLWPGESAIGKRLTGGPRPPQDGRWSTVVGVVSDLRRERLDTAPILSVFMPRLLQNMDLTIRSATRADVLLAAIRQELRSLDPTLPLASLTTAERRLDAQLSSRRFESQALGAFAAVSLALAAAGLYAMLAFQVGLRTREIGIRAALARLSQASSRCSWARRSAGGDRYLLPARRRRQRRRSCCRTSSIKRPRSMP